MVFSIDASTMSVASSSSSSSSSAAAAVVVTVFVKERSSHRATLGGHYEGIGPYCQAPQLTDTQRKENALLIDFFGPFCIRCVCAEKDWVLRKVGTEAAATYVAEIGANSEGRKRLTCFKLGTMLAMQVLADHTPHVFHAGLDLVHILLKDGTSDDHGDDRDDDKPCFSSQSLEAIHVRVALAGLFPVLETRAGTATPVGLKKIFDTVEFICAQQHCGFVSVGYHGGRYNDPTIPWQRLTGRLLLLGHVIDIGGFARDGDLTLEHTMETARTFMQNPNPSIRRAAIELVMTSYRHAGMDVERYLRGLQKNLMETLEMASSKSKQKRHPEDRRRIKAKRIYHVCRRVRTAATKILI